MNISNLLKRNLWATFYFNFKMLPLKQAIKLPFEFYGKVRFPSLKGQVIINVPVKRGLMQFGRAESEIFPKEETLLSIMGKLIVAGDHVFLGSGTVLEVSPDAEASFGSDILIAPRTRILVKSGLSIGSHVRISWDSQIFDSNFHYMRNVLTGKIAPRSKPVKIGSHVWIGNRVTINKGTVLPDYTIVASGSLCNKDYTMGEGERITIAGTPAKVVATGYERIFETKEPEFAKELEQKEREGLL